MEEKLLTPIQLWQNYNPITEPLNINIVKQYTIGDNILKEIYIDGIKDSDSNKNVRIFIRMAYSMNSKKAPAVLFIDSLDGFISAESLSDRVTQYGIVAVTYDYCGNVKANEYVTTYSAPLSYAKYPECLNGINNATPSAEESCWFVWSKLGRRVLTFMQNDHHIADEKIAVCGLVEGSTIMWHLSALDNRVKAACSLLGYGFKPFQLADKLKNKEEIKFTDDNERWLAAFSAQSYAQYLNCPIITFVASNNSFISADRMIRLLSLTQNDTNRYIVINPRLDNQLYSYSKRTFDAFIKTYLKGSKSLSNAPQLSIKIEDNKIILNIKVDGKPSCVSVFYSHYETRAAYRNWSELQAEKTSDESNYTLTFDKNDFSNVFYCFANVKYREVLLSTPILVTSVSEKQFKKGTNRILYEGKMGTGNFSVSTSELFVEDTLPHLDKGAFGINGITTDKGSLITFKLGDPNYMPEETSIFQLDAYTEVERQIVVTFHKEIEDKLILFKAQYLLKPASTWTKVKFELNDFKTDDYIVMKNWSNIIKTEINNVNGVLINNILWV